MSDCKTCGKTGLQPDSIHTCTPVALRLADHLERFRSFPDDLAAAAELRRLHDENERLKTTQYGSGRLQTLRDEIEAKDALLRQALEFLDQHCAVKHPSQIAPRDDLIDAIRQHLENNA